MSAKEASSLLTAVRRCGTVSVEGNSLWKSATNRTGTLLFWLDEAFEASMCSGDRFSQRAADMTYLPSNLKATWSK